MGNLRYNLPAPADNDAGAAVDVSAMGGIKTIVVNGTWTAPDKIPTVNIEINNAAVSTDGSWSPVATFRGTATKTVEVAARWMRVRVSGYTGGQAPEVEVASTDDGTTFANLAVPTGNGVGAPTAISALPAFKTLQIGGRFSGSIILEIANDAGGTEWATWQAMQAPGQQSQIAVAFWARIKRVGVPANDPHAAVTVVANLGACNPGSGDIPTETPFGISAGTQSVSTGTLVLSNSNGVTFGMSGSSQVTASVSSLVFSNANNVTFGVAGGTLTASIQTAGGTATGVGISAGTTNAETGAVVFSNSNGVSFGMNASTVTASVAAETPFGVSAGTQSVSTGTLVFSNSNNVSFGMSGSSRVTASASFPAETPFGVSAGTQSVSTGTLVFSDSNGLAFGMSGSSRVTGSYSTAVFSNSNGVSFGTNGSTVTASVAAETPFAISAGTQSVSTGTMVFSNSNGISFGMSGSSRITASYTQSTAPAAIGANTDTVSNGTVVFSNSNNVEFGLNGSTITASVVAAGETPFGISAGTQSVSTGTMVFSNSNGISFGMSGSSRITASYTQSTAPAAIGANTDTVSNGTVVFSNSNNVEFGLNGSTITASVVAAGETPFGISAGTQSVSTGTLVLSNSNGVTFGMSGSNRVTASFSTLVFANSNNVTFGTNAGTLTASAGGGLAVAAGTQTGQTGTIVFSNSNQLSFGMSGSSQVTARALQLSATATGEVMGGIHTGGVVSFFGSTVVLGGGSIIASADQPLALRAGSEVGISAGRSFTATAASDISFAAGRSIVMSASATNGDISMSMGRHFAVAPGGSMGLQANGAGLFRGGSSVSVIGDIQLSLGGLSSGMIINALSSGISMSAGHTNGAIALSGGSQVALQAGASAGVYLDNSSNVNVQNYSGGRLGFFNVPAVSRQTVSTSSDLTAWVSRIGVALANLGLVSNV